jgi:hypothetical protein
VTEVWSEDLGVFRSSFQRERIPGEAGKLIETDVACMSGRGTWAADFLAGGERQLWGRGCVKTPALRLRVENLSRFRQSEK